MINELYTLKELIDSLEQIRKEGEGNINFPKAIYCLAKEIEGIKQIVLISTKQQISEDF